MWNLVFEDTKCYIYIYIYIYITGGAIYVFVHPNDMAWHGVGIALVFHIR